MRKILFHPIGRGIRLGTVFQADSPETSVVLQWCGGVIFERWGCLSAEQPKSSSSQPCVFGSFSRKVMGSVQALRGAA